MEVQIRFDRPKFTQKAVSEYKKTVKLDVNLTELLWVLHPVFQLTPYGLYLEKSGSKGSYRKQCQELGRFTSQGLSNHIHLSEIVLNPVLQFQIGISAIRCWCQEIVKVKKIERAVIYLNAAYETSKRVNFILCVYSDPAPEDIRSLERYWSHSVEAMSPNGFFKWADKTTKRLGIA